MTVQSSPGDIVMSAGDFQRTDRGITWGIKFRNLGIGMVVFVVIKQADGTWKQPAASEAVIDSSFESSIVGHDSMWWIQNVLIPKLNAWLAKAFPAVGAPTPTPVTLEEKFADADAKTLAALKITQNSDGTLTASV